MKGQRRTLFWMFMSLALFGLVTGLLGCTKYTPYTAVWPMPFPQEKDSVLATTTCDMRGQPIIIVNKNAMENEVIPQWAWRYVMVHELDHASRMRAHPKGCMGALEQYRSDPDYRLNLEVEAKCAEYVAMKNDGIFAGNQGWDFLMVFTAVYQLYGGHISFEEFFRRIPCLPP